MQDEAKDFAAELKARIDETEDPAKKRELEARLARMQHDVQGTGSVKGRHMSGRHTMAAYVPGGGDIPKEPIENHGAPAFMNNDPKSNPDMEEGRDYDLGEPRVNDGMHDTEQIYQGKSVSGPINPDKRREGVKPASEADLEDDGKGNVVDKDEIRKSEKAESKKDESDKPAKNDGEASDEHAKQAESVSGPIDASKMTPKQKDADEGKSATATGGVTSGKPEDETKPKGEAAKGAKNTPKGGKAPGNDFTGSGGITLPKMNPKG